jgi:quinol monooxygenase YgiN
MSSLPPIVLKVTTKVHDFDAWKKAFDGRVDARREAGILGHNITRGTDDPSLISVYLPALDRAKLDAFVADMETRMQKSGLTDAPIISLLAPQEERAVHGRSVPAAMLTFEVESYDQWKSMFDSGVEFRKRGGVIGYAINRSVTNPNQVVVFLQGESAEKLRAHVTSSELATGMQKAGVRGAPQIVLLQDLGLGAKYAS